MATAELGCEPDGQQSVEPRLAEVVDVVVLADDVAVACPRPTKHGAAVDLQHDSPFSCREPHLHVRLGDHPRRPTRVDVDELPPVATKRDVRDDVDFFAGVRERHSSVRSSSSSRSAGAAALASGTAPGVMRVCGEPDPACGHRRRGRGAPRRAHRFRTSRRVYWETRVRLPARSGGQSKTRARWAAAVAGSGAVASGGGRATPGPSTGTSWAASSARETCA